MKILILAVSMILLVTSCGNFDVSNNSKYNYGFKVGYVYRTKISLQISAESPYSKSSSLMEIREIDKNRLAKNEILPRGSSFKINKLIYNNKSGLLIGLGIVLDGFFKGRVIETFLLTDSNRRVNGMKIYPNENLVVEIGKE